jgi:hypothetical protein
VPSQGGAQIELPAVNEPHNVIRWQRLLRNAGAKHTECDPCRQRNPSARSHTIEMEDDHACKNRQAGKQRRSEQVGTRTARVRRGFTQAEHNAGYKGCGNRYGRKLHGARLNRTKVSM